MYAQRNAWYSDNDDEIMFLVNRIPKISMPKSNQETNFNSLIDIFEPQIDYIVKAYPIILIVIIEIFPEKFY